MQDIKNKFYNDGYVVLENFFNEAEIDILKREGEKVKKNMPKASERCAFSQAGTDSLSLKSKDEYFLGSATDIRYFFEADALGPNGEFKVDESVALNKIGHALHELNPTFRKFTFDKRVKDVCKALGFQEPVVLQGMLNCKNPRIGSKVTPHQDASYLYSEPSNLVGFWIALEDATIENGCLWVAKGSHKTGLHRRYVLNPDPNANELLKYTEPAPDYPKSDFTPLPAKKGTCVLIHGLAVHYSEPNTSTKSRHAYVFHIIDEKNAKWAKDNWLQLPAGKKFLRLYDN